MKVDLSYLWSKLVQLLGSHKFWVLLFAAVGAYGLNIPQEVKAFIFFLAATIFSILKTIEDDTKIKYPAAPAAKLPAVLPTPINYYDEVKDECKTSWDTQGAPGQDGLP